MIAAVVPVGLLFVASARGRIGFREAPLAHLLVGATFAVQAALIAVAWTIGLVAGRKAAVAVALLLLVGWAGGAIIGHLGKLLSLSAWASWPPGPRPKQAALYPRRLWQIEVVLFFVAVEALADGVLIGSAPAVRAGASLLVVAAAAAAAGAGVTFARARRRRPAT